MRCYVGVVPDAHDPFPACDVCGRTILKGETIHEYLTDSRERIGVCVLCRSRAESSGWIPVSMAHTIAEEEPKRSRGHALKQRLSRAAARARASRGGRGDVSRRDESGQPEPPWEDFDSAMGQPNEGAWPPPADEVPQPEAAEVEQAPNQDQAPPEAAPQVDEERSEQPAKPTRARRQAKPRAKRQPRQRAAKREATPQAERPKPARKAKRGPEALMRRAVERFNSSEERRKVAGLIRSLGEPNAGVQPDQRRQLALVTVAWELSWYQWEVGADGDGDDGEPVREVAKGAEVSELDGEARAWNASVDEDGTLRLRSSTGQRKQAAQEA
jgi:hypothetical protein